MFNISNRLHVHFMVSCKYSKRVLKRNSIIKQPALKISYFNVVGSTPLVHWKLPDLVEKGAASYGDRTAYRVCHQNITKNYTEFKKDVDQLAAGLVSLNIPVGSIIGILCPNDYEWPVIQFATAKVGLVLANINTAYQAGELEYCLKKVNCHTLISAESFKTQDYYKLLSSIAPELEKSKPGELKSSRLPDLKNVIMLTKTPKPGVFSYDEIINSGTSQHYKDADSICSKVQFDSPVSIQFTSGTTGKPKGAVLSHFNMVNNAYTVGQRVRYENKPPVICVSVPMIHCFGCVVGTATSMIYGGNCVFPAPSFNAEASLAAISKEKCTMLYGTPTMFIDMMNHPTLTSSDVSSVEKSIIAGAQAPVEVVKSMMTKLNCKDVYIVYGCTETSPVVSAADPKQPIEKWISTIGRPLDHLQVKVVNQENEIVPINAKGELCVRGYSTFLGYYGEKDKTYEVLKEDGWYHTGDEVTLSEDGYITICGRIKDMIIRGGENVYPLEIEEFLYTHPAVEEVQVFGVPDKRLGEEICAWIKVKDSQTLTEEEIKAFCKGKISHFKIPKYVMFVTKFPKTISGKIQKFKIREESIKTLGL